VSHLETITNPAEQENTGIYVMPATPLQVRLFCLADQTGPDAAWNIAVRFGLSGLLDREAIEAALQMLVQRHEMLRSCFASQQRLTQIHIYPRRTLPVEWCDLRTLSAHEQEGEVARLSSLHSRLLHSMNSGPLMLVRMLRLAEDNHLMLWNVHHSVCDGWSIGLMATDLMECYKSIVFGNAAPTQEMLDFGDYAVWLDAQRRTQEYEEHRTYWRQQLAGLTVASLPVAWRNSDVEAAPAIVSRLLPRQLTSSMSALAQQHGATFFHVALSVFGTLLQAQQATSEVCIGTPVSGREQAEVEKAVGPFVNYLPLRLCAQEQWDYPALLQVTQNVAVDALDHAQFRFEDMMGLSSAGQLNSDGNEPVQDERMFCAVFICQQDFVHATTLAGLSLTAVPSVSPGALHPITVFLVEREDGWRLSCEVDNRSVSTAAGSVLLSDYERLLTCLVARPESSIASLLADAFLPPMASSDSGPHPADLQYSTHRTSSTSSTGPMPIQLEPELKKLPASESQFRFWMLDRMNPGSHAFDLRIRLELTGALNVEALKDAAERVMQDNEVLRTTLEESEGQVWQCIHRKGVLDFQIVAAALDSPEAVSLQQEEKAPFSLSTGPLFRIRLQQVEKDRHQLSITLSHAIADGWSSGLFLSQLGDNYQRQLCVDLPTQSMGDSNSRPQFAAYLQKEASLLTGPEKDLRLDWWQEHLNGTWRPLCLPRDRSRKTLAMTTAGGQTSTQKPPKAGVSIVNLAPCALLGARRFAKETHATMFAVFGAAFQSLISRYTAENDILFVTPFANRSEEEESVLGPLAVPVCLTGHISPATTFRELVLALSERSMDAMEHVLPISMVAPLMDMRVSPEYHSLNQITFFHQRAFVHDMEWGTLRIKSLPEVPDSPGGEWQLGVVERKETTSVEFLYDTSLYSEQTMDLVQQHYTRLLSQAVMNPDLPLSKLQIITKSEVDAHAAGFPLLPVTECLVHGVSDRPATEIVEVKALAGAVGTEPEMRRIWLEIFGHQAIEPEMDFFDLGGHSLLLARLQTAVERKWKVRLTTADVFRHPTLRGLAGWLEQMLSGATTVSVRQAGRFEDIDPHIIPIQPFGTERPLFVISQSMIFRTLALELGPEQPVFALQMIDEDVTAEMEATGFAGLAAFYVRLIRKMQPVGPYRLSGWCVAGWIAYEVARQLEELGEQVELLMIMDAWAPEYWTRWSAIRRVAMQGMYRLQRFRWISHRLHQSSAKDRNAYIRRSFHGLAAAAAQNLTYWLNRMHLPVRVKLTEEMRRSEQLEYSSSRIYKAGAVRGNILFFRSEEQPGGPLLASDMGWSHVLGRSITVESLPGDHQEIFDLAGARIMAKRVAQLFSAQPINSEDVNAARGALECPALPVQKSRAIPENSCARWR